MGYNFEAYALILIEGIEASNEAIESLNVVDIDKIDVLERGAAVNFGMSGANGKINIITRQGRKYMLNLKKMQGTIINRIKGFYRTTSFFTALYAK